jgi:hypothetical protein
MVNSLIAIAAFIATIGAVIFGVLRYENQAKQESSVERVEPSPLPNPVPEPVSESVPESVPKFVVEPVAEPIAEPVAEPVVEPAAQPVAESAVDVASEETQTALDLGEIAAAPVAEVPQPLPEVDKQPASDQLSLDLTAPVEEEEYLEPRSQVETVAIAPTIQDPKRPNSDALENLTQDLRTWGQSKNSKHAPKLTQYASHPNPLIRSQAIAALGQITAQRPVDATVERMIPILGQRIQDPNLQVRQLAVKSLGNIRSPKVLPYLEQALQSPSNGVKKAAQDALRRLNLGYIKPTLPLVLKRKR